jgi:predicted PurR-regulated permease PerM
LLGFALVPAALLAMMHGPDKLIYGVSLYQGIQAVESYVLTPLLQQQMVDLPPLLSSACNYWVLVGGLRIILATPLTAAFLVLVKIIYIEDILQDPESGLDRLS